MAKITKREQVQNVVRGMTVWGNIKVEDEIMHRIEFAHASILDSAHVAAKHRHSYEVAADAYRKYRERAIELSVYPDSTSV